LNLYSKLAIGVRANATLNAILLKSSKNEIS
jgi:hypothetical protein